MLRAVVLTLAAVTPTVANAETVILWNDLAVGMTKPEVKALHPKSLTNLSPGCDAWMDLTYEQKKLSVVNLSEIATSDRKDCGVMVERTLMAKYGPPAKTDATPFLQDCTPSGRGFVAALSDALCRGEAQHPKMDLLHHWFVGPVEITMARREGDEVNFSVTYRLATQASADAAGKL